MKKLTFLIILGIVFGFLSSFAMASTKDSSEQQKKQTVTKKENKKLLNPKKISIDEMKDLISRGADVNIRNWGLNTPLHVSIIKGYKDILDLLISKGDFL